MSWPDKNWRSVQFCVQLGRARDVRIPILRVHPRMPRVPHRRSGVADQHVGVVRGAGYGAASPANASAGSYMPAVMRNIPHKRMHDLHTHTHNHTQRHIVTHFYKHTYSLSHSHTRTHTYKHTYMRNVSPVHAIIHHMPRPRMRQSTVYTRTCIRQTQTVA